jgi:hypothetical protein
MSAFTCGTCLTSCSARGHTEGDCIEALLTQRAVLRQQVAELTELAMRGVATSDRMKLDLILSGALVKPSSAHARGR